jgi:hypothetical protein
MAHAAGATCFFRGELVGRAFCMGRFAALAGDLALTLRIHRRKTAITGTAALAVTLITALFVALI